MADRFGDSSDYSEQAIHFGGQDGGDISADRFGGSTQEMRFGNDGDENVTTTERSAYRRVKVSQAVARKERHLVRTNPSQLEQGGVHNDDDDDDVIDERYKFKVLSPEEEPVFHDPKTKTRAKKVITAIAKLTTIKEPETTKENLKKSKMSKEERKEHRNSQLLNDAGNIGRQMAPKILFPGLSSLMQDLWVYAENGITLYQFISSAKMLQSQKTTLGIITLAFSTVALVLAAIDFFFYFVQLGSCARIIRTLVKKFRHKEESDDNGNDEAEGGESAEGRQRCVCISEKWKERLETWFETSRNVLSELVLFPLLVFDLFGFITGSPYLFTKGEEDVQGVAFFVVSTCFFFVLSVYIMRIFVLLSTTAVLTQMPLDICNSQKDTTSFVISFAITALGQMVSQFSIILAIGVKIKQETPIVGTDVPNVSPFLICLILLGAAIPNFGLLAYFLVNYFEFKDFSVGMFINMMSLLQSESFAETVFGGEAGEKPLEKAEELTEKFNLSRSKQVFDKKKQSSDNKWTAKVLAAMKIPILVLTGVLYYSVIIAFLVCLVLTRDNSTGEIQFVLFRYSGLCIAFFLVSVSLLVSNMYSLMIIHVWILVAFLMGFSTLLSLAFWCVWSPFACIISYVGCLRDVARDLELV